MRGVGRENRTTRRPWFSPTPIWVTSAPADHRWAICSRARYFNGLLALWPALKAPWLNGPSAAIQLDTTRSRATRALDLDTANP